jgi:hypothetical protein
VRRTLLAASLAAGAVLLAGCGGDEDPSPPKAAASSTDGACPSPAGDAQHWGGDVPSDIPRLPGMTVDSGDTTQGVQHVYFSVPMSFTDSVASYLEQLPAAGFALGTGDSEESEADIPFSKDGRQFSLKLRGVPDPCRTDGLLSVGGEPETD